MTARDEAVEAGARVLARDIYDRKPDWSDVVVAKHLLDAALPVLLDGLDREALGYAITGHRHVMPPVNSPDCLVCRESLGKADAVIAHLRDEWSS